MGDLDHRFGRPGSPNWWSNAEFVEFCGNQMLKHVVSLSPALVLAFFRLPELLYIVTPPITIDSTGQLSGWFFQNRQGQKQG
jgi:hypothetical protein